MQSEECTCRGSSVTEERIVTGLTLFDKGCERTDVAILLGEPCLRGREDFLLLVILNAELILTNALGTTVLAVE